MALEQVQNTKIAQDDADNNDCKWEDMAVGEESNGDGSEMGEEERGAIFIDSDIEDM